MRYLACFVFSLNALLALPRADFDETTKRYEGKIAFFVDTQNRGIEEIAALPEATFRVTEALNLGFERHPVWIRLEIHNSAEAAQFIVEVGQPLLHFVDFYDGETSDRFTKLHAGRLATQRTGLRHHKILFPVHVRKNQTKIVYLRISTRDTLIAPVIIWRSAEFTAQEKSSNMAMGAFYGIIFIIFIYNFFLYLSLRDRSYGYYLLYLISFAVYRLSVDGSIYPLLEPTVAWLNWRLPLFTMAAISMFLMFFTDSFLELRQRSPVLSRIVRTLALVIPLTLPFTVSDGGMAIVTQLVNILGGIGVILVVFVSIASLRQKIRQARFFVLAEAAFFCAVAVSALVNLGKLPPNIVTLNIMPAGFLIELALLSIGLADKMTHLRQQNAEINLRAERAELESARLEIEAVKTIISPHSLLNSIQSIANDIGRNPSRATDMLSDLATEFRSLIGWAKKTEISLADEVKLCEAHLRIMGRRTGHRYSFKAPKKLDNLAIPPLILHTLVENAMSHEAKNSRGLSFTLTVKENDAGKLAYLSLHCKGKLSGGHSGAGVGLKYVQTRLEQSYPGAYTLKEDLADNFWQVDLTLG